jgi:mannose-1-phosphate guanylyltransferase/phosphomannomutase
MFKHAFISGILSVGVEVFNLSGLLTPISRYAINFLSVEGGIHIKLSEGNPNRICADFMDSKGATISRATERKIENSFVREDFKRCTGEDVSRLNNITDFRNYYIRAIMNEIDISAIRNTQPKIVLVSPSGLVSSLLMQILPDVGVKVVSSITKAYEEDYEDIFKEIKKANADFGVYIDSNGENLILFDNKKRIVTDDLLTALISIITFESSKSSNVIIPITASTVIEKLAEKYGGTVTRTKTSSRAVMEEMLNNNLYKNNEKMGQFMLSFDAFAGLLKIIESYQPSTLP